MGVAELTVNELDTKTAHGAKTAKVVPASSEIDDAQLITNWLNAFEKAVATRERDALDDLFIEDSHWRDLFVFTWTITPRNGRDDVVTSLLKALPQARPRNFRIAEGRTPPRRASRSGEKVIEAIYEFETDTTRGTGVLRLPVERPEKAWMISTSLHEIKGAEGPVGPRRPTGQHDRLFGGQTKAQRRAKELEYSDRHPDVLVIGGGHNGISTAAQLRMLGVDALVVERLRRVGDVWRNRYGALALHNKIASEPSALHAVPG